jgi:hypothetical protein
MNPSMGMFGPIWRHRGKCLEKPARKESRRVVGAKAQLYNVVTVNSLSERFADAAHVVEGYQ